MDVFSSLTQAQATLFAAAMAAVVAGTFGLVNALLNGWNAKRQARDAALREYRMKECAAVIALARQRLGGLFGAQLGGYGGAPLHHETYKILYGDGPLKPSTRYSMATRCSPSDAPGLYATWH